MSAAAEAKTVAAPACAQTAWLVATSPLVRAAIEAGVAPEDLEAYVLWAQANAARMVEVRP